MVIKLPQFPTFPPRPPLPGESPFEVEEEETNTDEAFKERMKSKGFDLELIEMGLKVARNHMKEPEDAYKIGENYIREMAK